MRIIPPNESQKRPGTSRVSKAGATEDSLRRLAFDNSLQANIIFTVSSGKIVIANNAACKLLGYSKKELLTKSRVTIFDIKESSFKKMLAEKTDKGHSRALVTAIKKNGNPFPCEITSAVFMDEKGIEKTITTLTDITQVILKQISIDIKKAKIVAHNIVLDKAKQQEVDIKKEKTVAHNIKLAKAKSDEEKLEQEMATKAGYTESYKLIFKALSDVVLFDSDLVTNKVIVSNAYENEFGYKITGNMTQAEDWISHIHPDDKEAVMLDYFRMLASHETEWKYSYRFLRADNSVANILSSRIILRNANGKAYRMIGSMHDISRQQVLEEKLDEEIKLKEKQIAEATEEAKEAERSDIGKELHDNVNQLLGASTLYLEMAKEGGENSKMYLIRSSDYMLMAIEEIRKLTKGLTTGIIRNLGLREAIDIVTRDTMEVNPVKISCALQHFKEQRLNDKFKLNVFRIVQEQLNNILKHAKATEVAIGLLQRKKSIILSIADNGVGFDMGQKQKGIGVANIKNRATLYNGTADFVSQPGRGCVLTVKFPVTDALLSKRYPVSMQ